MLILSRVCVDFRTREGKSIFEVKPSMLNTFQEAPDAIKQDPIFPLLVADGSLEAVVSAARKKDLENDPIQDTDPSGKRRKTGRGKDKEVENFESSSPTVISSSESIAAEVKGKTPPAVTITKDSKVPDVKEKESDIHTVASDKSVKQAAGK